MSQIGWESLTEQEETIDDPGLRGRLYFLRLLVVLILGVLLLRVYLLQQTEGSNLALQAEDNQFAELTLDPPRGVIFDRQGQQLAVNLASFDVTITPAFLPANEDERLAVFERLSFLTGVPVTNTVAQQELAAEANPALVSTYSRLAELYGAPVQETLDQAGIVPDLPDSIIEIYETFAFAQYLPATVAANVPMTLAHTIEQESIFMPGVQVLPTPLRSYPSGEFTSHIVGFMGPIPNEGWLDLGYERDDRVGWSGIEVSMEEELAGLKGNRLIEVDWTGRELRQIGETTESVAGLNLHLTLDLELQLQVYEILENTLQRRRETPDIDYITGERRVPEVEQAVIVALNVNTGEILAMVNLPTFDNNRFTTEVPVDYYLGLARNDYEPLLNHAIAGQYPPGSTFKMVTAAGALQEGVISPNRYLRAPGAIRIPNRYAPNDPGRDQEFVCWINQQGGEHGLMNMLLGISNSCDIYFYKIAGGFDQDGETVEALGINRLSYYANQFGFGRIQGIELPIEAPGNIPTAAWKALNYGEPWSTGDDYNAAIGQGFVTSTPMQIAQMAAVVASGGFLYRPAIIHHMTDEFGNVVVRDQTTNQLVVVIRDDFGNITYQDRRGNPLDPEQVNVRVQFDADGEFVYQPDVLQAVDVDREYINVLAEGMRLVNTEAGTGTGYVDWLDEFGITSAGKTGTAEYCDQIAQKRGWCIEGRILPTHSWYVGYAPYENPEIAVVGFIFNGGEGSQFAAPAVRETMTAYFEVGDYAPAPETEEGIPAENVPDADLPINGEPEQPPEDTPAETP
jgi:penicillin-binding protein 2